MKKYKNITQEAYEFGQLAVRIYDKGYEDGYKEGKLDGESEQLDKDELDYEKGLNDAWMCARKIINSIVQWEAFDLRTGQASTEAINFYTASEAISKIKEYEEKQKQGEEIKIGDEVTTAEKIKGVVIGIINRGWSAVRFINSPTAVGVHNNTITKTGHNYPEIAEILNQMQEGEEN